jgi:NitT/TauT family transport system substrate-binding protein
MFLSLRRAVVAVFVLAGILSYPPGPALAQGKSMTDLTFSLDFIVLGRHAPWYVALDKGYYKAEGLNVKIIPGRGSASVISNVESGVAELGFVDVPSLVVSRAKGSTIKMVAINYQKAPYAVFSLDPGANVTKPKDLEGLTLTTAPGSFVPAIIEAFMKNNGLDPTRLKYDFAAPSAQIPMLASGKAQAINFFILTMPGIKRLAKGQNKTARALFFGDFGLQLYSNGIGAKESFLRDNPEVVRKFVRASLKGWRDTFADPADAAARQKKYAKGLNEQITIEEIAILKKLAVTPDTMKNGLGWFSPAKIRQSRDFMVENAKVDPAKAPSAEDLYDLGFLPKTPILP